MIAKATGTDKLLVEGKVGETELAKIARLVQRTPCTQLALTRVRLATGEALAQIFALFPKLADLSIYASKLSDWAPLAKVKTLRKLFLNGVAVDKVLPAEIGRLSKLVDLSLLHMPRLAKIDLSGCVRLERFQAMSCRSLRDLSSLHALPRLREIVLVGTAHAPKDLKPLLALPQVRHVAAQFGSVRLNAERDALLAKYGKTQYPGA